MSSFTLVILFLSQNSPPLKKNKNKKFVFCINQLEQTSPLIYSISERKKKKKISRKRLKVGNLRYEEKNPIEFVIASSDAHFFSITKRHFSFQGEGCTRKKKREFGIVIRCSRYNASGWLLIE